MVSPLWHHIELLQYYWVYSLCCTLHPCHCFVATFPCLLTTCISSLWKDLYKSFVHFLKIELLSLVICIFWLLSLIRRVTWKYFLIQCVALLFSWYCLWCTHFKNFHYVLFVYFFSCWLCLSSHIQKLIAKSNVGKFFPMFFSKSFIV